MIILTNWCTAETQRVGAFSAGYSYPGFLHNPKNAVHLEHGNNFWSSHTCRNRMGIGPGSAKLEIRSFIDKSVWTPVVKRKPTAVFLCSKNKKRHYFCNMEAQQVFALVTPAAPVIEEPPV